jgi:hypothetical protein
MRVTLLRVRYGLHSGQLDMLTIRFAWFVYLDEASFGHLNAGINRTPISSRLAGQPPRLGVLAGFSRPQKSAKSL